MAKPVKLTPGDLTATATSPQAATPPRTPKTATPTNVPLQVRVPRDEAKAIRVSAAEREMSISDFVRMCVADWRSRQQ